jgi:dTDP-4-amino-4,6-dideoxygalactose transaminase
MRVWIRKRLDISGSDLLHGLLGALAGGDPDAVRQRIVSRWKRDDTEALTLFTVRTALDLLFQAADYPHSDEVIVSALTIPDMPSIIRKHGLVPVPVDIRTATTLPDAADIEAAVSPRSRAILVAHLFGARGDLGAIAAVARRHGLLLIEDCAQCYEPGRFRGDSEADVSLFSFGTIKTATALGGAVMLFRGAGELCGRVAELESRYRVQSRWAFLRKLLKYAALEALATPWLYGLVLTVMARRGIDRDQVLHGLSRGFPTGDLLANIRQRPSLPLLRLLDRRLGAYRCSRTEVLRGKARLLLDSLPPHVPVPGREAGGNTHWVFPLLSADREALIARLRANGFDATARQSMQVVEDGRQGTVPAVLPCSRKVLDTVVFLPLHCGMPDSEVRRMGGLLCGERCGGPGASRPMLNAT